MADYLKKEYFESLLVARKLSGTKGVSAELAHCFFLIASNLCKRYKFRGVPADDAVQEAIFTCISKIDHYEPKRGAAFGYFTTVSLNTFRQLYRKNTSSEAAIGRYRAHLEAEQKRLAPRNKRRRVDFREEREQGGE